MDREIRYKLTDENGRSKHGDHQWGPGIRHTVPGLGDFNLSRTYAGWIRVYTDPLLAVLLNIVHTNYKNPRMWRCEVCGKSITEYGLREGWSDVITVEEMAAPALTREQKVRFGILCALPVTHQAINNVDAAKHFMTWAHAWLDGTDRSERAAKAAGSSGLWAGTEEQAIIGPAWEAKQAAQLAACAAEGVYWWLEHVGGAAQNAAYASNGIIDLIALAKRAMEAE